MRPAPAALARLVLGAMVAMAGSPAAAQGARAPAAAAASAPQPASAASTSGPQAIVVTGQAADAAEQRRLAVAGVSVVGRDELDAFGDNSVLDVLQRQAGISVDGEAPRLRGMGEGYTVVLLNGEPAPPGFALDSLAPADIERIEITKGPTAEHGGAAGVINIILRVPPKLRQREFRLALGYRAVQPQGNSSLGWGDRLGEGAQTLGFHLPLSVYRRANAGALSVQRNNRSPTAGWSAQHLQGDDQWLGQGLSFSPRLDWKRSAHESLQLQLFVQANQSNNRGARQTQVLLGTAPTASTSGQWMVASGNAGGGSRAR
jgi:iron complex outermembrane receptor protein